MYGLTILTTHIQNGSNRGAIHEVTTTSMTCNLCDSTLTERNIDTTISSANGIDNILQFETCIFHGPVYSFHSRVRAIRTSSHIRISIQLTVSKYNSL